MSLNHSNKVIIDLLSKTNNLDSYGFYKKLDKAIKNIIGHKLFTLTVIDSSTKYVERVYSNNKKIYPLLGTKPIPNNAWTRKVIIEKKQFLASNFEEIKKLFFDHEIIQSLGCGSIINIPILNNKKILGTLNVLHKEKYYTKKSVNNIKPFAQLLAPYFIVHQLSMKNK